MNNRQFHFLLRKLKTPCACILRGQVLAGRVTCANCGNTGHRRLTVGRIAEAIYVSRPRLNEVLNNKAGRGALTRPKVVRYLEREFPERKAELLAALGWDEDGNLVTPHPGPLPIASPTPQRGEGAPTAGVPHRTESNPMEQSQSPQTITVQCSCGNNFQTLPRVPGKAGRTPKTCPACKRATKKKCWAGRRRRLRNVTDGVSGGRKKEFMSFATIGHALALSRMTVNEAYRTALLKLRENGGEVLREVLQRQGLSGLMEILREKSKPGDPALKLMEYQFKVLPLWATHDNLVALQMKREALKVRVEIERFQRRMKSELERFINA